MAFVHTYFTAVSVSSSATFAAAAASAELAPLAPSVARPEWRTHLPAVLAAMGRRVRNQQWRPPPLLQIPLAPLPMHYRACTRAPGEFPAAAAAPSCAAAASVHAETTPPWSTAPPDLFPRPVPPDSTDSGPQDPPVLSSRPYPRAIPSQRPQSSPANGVYR